LFFKKNDTLITKKSGQKIALIGALANDKTSPLEVGESLQMIIQQFRF
jgi:hypothetical protein